MKMNPFTLRAIALRRQRRDLTAQGYQFISEPVWQIIRGARTDEIITDVKISSDGKSLYVLTGPKEDWS